MKAYKNYLLTVLLILSFLCNALLLFYLFETKEPYPSITKFGFSEQDKVVYCENSDNVEYIAVDINKGSYTIGNAELISEGNSLYLVTSENKINLSDYNAAGFVINSNGEILYTLTQ